MDQVGFEQLAMAELDAVYRLACRLAAGTHEAEDAVQETYLRAFRSVHTFVPAECGIRPWLFKILHHVLYNRNATEHRQRLIVKELHHTTPASSDGERATKHDVCSVDWEHVDENLKSAIDALPPVNRAAFLLSAVEGLKYREIADVTDVPLGTVMSRLHRARDLLTARLGVWAVDEGWPKRTPRTGDISGETAV